MKMLQFVALVAGLLMASDAQVSNMADDAKLHGFLSGHMPVRSGDYDKFVIPNLNSIKHASRPNVLSYGKDPAVHGIAASDVHESHIAILHDQPTRPAEYTEDLGLPKSADQQEKKAVQKLLAYDTNTAISLSAIGAALLTLVTMLGARVRRGLQPTTLLASSSAPMVPALEENILELEPQDSIPPPFTAVATESRPPHQVNLKMAAALAPVSRRLALSFAPAAIAFAPSLAQAADNKSVKADAARVLEALQPLEGLIDENKWDGVRTVLKTPPVAELWERSLASKNYVRNAALAAGDPDLIELTEDLSSALQLADQYVYDNNFIYFQPGNGKVKIKEPKDQIKVAKTKLKAIIASLE